MIPLTLLLTIIGIGLGMLQSTVFSRIMPMGIVPDLALILIVASAWKYGSLLGELSGFFIGLSYDAMSLSHFGFHAFLFTIVGYVFGRLKGNLVPGAVILPVLAAATATLLKYGGSFLLALIFGLNSGATRYFSMNSALELLFNMILAPVVFLLVSLLARLSEGQHKGI